MKLNIDTSDFDKQYNEEVARLEREAKMKLLRVGEVYISTSKESGSYQDDTGNLRNANGYGLKEHGTLTTIVAGRSETEKGIEVQSAKTEIEVICGNGMDYASHVQRKGYVVTDAGQLAAEAEAKRLFSK